MVENALQQALAINRQHRDRLEGLVKSLMEKETLDAPEVLEIFGEPPVPDDPEAGMVRQQVPSGPNGATAQG